MKVMTEKEAERFLIREGFDVAGGMFVKNKSGLKKIDFSYPHVAKASGKNIIHKKDLGGIVLDVDSLEKAEKSFDKIKKIKGTEEVFFQRQVSGKEFLVGVKKAPEFGHVVVFGVGGSGVEQKNDFAFRVCPLDNKDAISIINDTTIGRSLDNKEKKIIRKNIMKISELVKKFPKIKELDINPLMLGGGVGVGKDKAYIVDARMVLE